MRPNVNGWRPANRPNGAPSGKANETAKDAVNRFVALSVPLSRRYITDPRR